MAVHSDSTLLAPDLLPHTPQRGPGICLFREQKPPQPRPSSKPDPSKCPVDALRIWTWPSIPENILTQHSYGMWTWPNRLESEKAHELPFTVMRIISEGFRITWWIGFTPLYADRLFSFLRKGRIRIQFYSKEGYRNNGRRQVRCYK